MTKKSEQQVIEEFEEWWNMRDSLIKDLVSDAHKDLCRCSWLAAFRKYHNEVEDNCGQRRDETMKEG